MRILAITNMFPSPAFPTSGVFVEQQVQGLRAIGLDVRVLLVNRRQDGCLAYFRMHRDIDNAIAEFDPGVIHAMYGGVMAERIARRHHVRPLMVTFHGSDLLGENLSGWARRMISRYGVRCSRNAAKAAEGVIVVARHLIGSLNGAASRGKIRVIPCGIDLERFQPMDSLACKRRLGWCPESFHAVFASCNGDPVKRPGLARAAIARMSRSDRPAILHCLTGIPNAEVPVWLNASDALLLTSMHEGSPTVVKEALACGLPVVSVDVGDVAERIEGVAGCHLAQPEPADLSAKLCLVRRLGRRLERGPWLEELSILNVALRLKRCYEDIARVPNNPRRFHSSGALSASHVSPSNCGAASPRH